MNVKELLQEFCRRQNLPVPNSVQGSSDAQVRQILGLTNELLEDLTTRTLWQQNTIEKVHTTIADIDQGNIETLCPGFVSIVPRSFFNRSGNLRVYFGLTPEEWQARQTIGGMDGPSYWARLRGNKLIVDPEPPAGQTWAWEYYSQYYVMAEADSSLKQYFNLDTDTFILPDRILLSWIRWRWKAEKGLDYAEDFRKYETHIDLLSKRNNGPQVADMGAFDDGRVKAGIVIPIGTWELP